MHSIPQPAEGIEVSVGQVLARSLIGDRAAHKVEGADSLVYRIEDGVEVVTNSRFAGRTVVRGPASRVLKITAPQPV